MKFRKKLIGLIFLIFVFISFSVLGEEVVSVIEIGEISDVCYEGEVCAKEVEVGKFCYEDDECAKNEVCVSDFYTSQTLVSVTWIGENKIRGFCHLPRAQFSLCIEDNECQTGLACIGSHYDTIDDQFKKKTNFIYGTCNYKLKNGDNCYSSLNCDSGHCLGLHYSNYQFVSGKCGQSLLDGGQVCYNVDDCKSGVCEGNKFEKGNTIPGTCKSPLAPVPVTPPATIPSLPSVSSSPSGVTYKEEKVPLAVEDCLSQQRCKEVDEVWQKIGPLIRDSSEVWDTVLGNYNSYDKVYFKTIKTAISTGSVTSTAGTGTASTAGGAGVQVTLQPSVISAKEVMKKFPPNVALLEYGKQFVGVPYVYGGYRAPTIDHKWTTCSKCIEQKCKEACSVSSNSCYKCIDAGTENHLGGWGAAACFNEGNCIEDANCRNACRSNGICRNKLTKEQKQKKKESIDKGEALNPALYTGTTCPLCSKNDCRASGFDCQGFVAHVLLKTWKYYIGGGATNQYKRCNKLPWCTKIELGKDYNPDLLQPGDIFWDGTRDGNGDCVVGSIKHVGYYFGKVEGKHRTLEAATGVKIGELDTTPGNSNYAFCAAARLTYTPKI